AFRLSAPSGWDAGCSSNANGSTSGLRIAPARPRGNAKIRGMPSINAFDAGKRQMDASKAFSERQPTIPQTREASGVGCLLVGGRVPAMQDAGPSIPNVKSGSRSSALRNSQRNQLWQSARSKAGLHGRAVRERGLRAVLPAQLEGINRRHFGTD